MKSKNHERLNTAQTEKFIGLSRQSIWRKYKAGTFPEPHYLGNLRFWYVVELEEWLNKNIKNAPSHLNFVPKNKSIAAVEPEQ